MMDPPSTSAMLVFNAQPTIGALFIGLLISCFLFGILTLQAYLYYTSFPTDRQIIKALVYFVWICELAHSICVCHAVYYLAIVGYGNPSFLMRAPDSLSVAILFSGLIGPLVQIFFAERVRVVSGGKLTIPIFCWTLSTLRLALSIVATVAAIDQTTLVEFQAHWKWLLTLILSIGVTNDVVIAVSLTGYLTQRKANSIKRTAMIIDRIVVWTVQTGILTSIASILMIICFVAMPNNFVWLAIFTFLARLYSNSLLASLNARVALRSNNIIDSTISPSRTNRIGSSSMNVPGQQLVIQMSTLKEEVHDKDFKMDTSEATVAADDGSFSVA